MICWVEPGGRAVEGVGLRPHTCWDCEFESRRGMDVCILCVWCLVSGGLCDGPIPRPEEFCRVCVCH